MSARELGTIKLGQSVLCALLFLFLPYGAWAAAPVDAIAAGTYGSPPPPPPPTVTVQAASNVVGSTATLHGNITSTGGVTISVRGFVWNTSGTPTLSDNVVTVSGSGGTGAYTGSLTRLGAGPYYVRAWATNVSGTSLSSDQISLKNTYYFNAVSGADATGAANDINHPYQTVSQFNAMIQAGTFVDGDTIALHNGASPFQQEFVGMCDLADWGVPPNLSFVAYGPGPYMPVMDNLAPLTGWNGPDSNGVYTLAADSCVWLFEDHAPLIRASGSNCARGNWYFASGIIYYKPTRGTPGNRAAIGLNQATYIHGCNGLTFNRIAFVGSNLYIVAGSPGVINLTVQNCRFKYAYCKVEAGGNGQQVNGVNINHCNYDHSWGPSQYLCSGAGNGPAAGLTNIYYGYNTITNNNVGPDGKIWYNEDQDVDAIYAQNWGTAVFEHNDISGYTGTGVWSSALQVYISADDNAFPTIGGYADNGSGLIRIRVTLPQPAEIAVGDYIFVYGAIGTGAPNGKWQVAATGSGYLDLRGSSSTGYSGWSGGTMYHDVPFTPNVTVRNNFIHDELGRMRSAFHLDSGSTFVASNHVFQVYDNIVARASAYAYCIAKPQAPGGGSMVCNNVAQDCATISQSAAYAMNGATNTVIKNNIGAGAATTVFASDVAAGRSNTWGNNDWFGGVSRTPFSWGGTNWLGTPKSFAGWKTATRGETNSTTANPMFINASGSFTLASDFIPRSPACFRKGVWVGLTTDYAGKPVGNPPCIGAFEFLTGG